MANRLIYQSDYKTIFGAVNTLIVSRTGGGDFMIGVNHVLETGESIGTNSVTFRTANGGASAHPRLISALLELENALKEIQS